MTTTTLDATAAIDPAEPTVRAAPAGTVRVLDRDAYQSAVRALLVAPLVTDASTLASVRRFEHELRADFDSLVRYRLEVSPTCARLVKRPVGLDASRPLRRANQDKSPFDRRRYAYLCLALAVLGRSGAQTTVSALADSLRRRAAEIDHLGFDPDVTAQRRGLVDVLAWLERRGAITVCDGSARAWLERSDDADALYDVDREVVHHLFHPPAIVQSAGSVTDLLVDHYPDSREGRRLRRRHRITRRLLEDPAVVYADLPADERDYVRREGASIAAEVEVVTGCVVERRAEGMALVDPGARCSDRSFPATSTVSWCALLLLDKMLAARPRRPTVPLLTEPAVTGALRAGIDEARPSTGDTALTDALSAVTFEPDRAGGRGEDRDGDDDAPLPEPVDQGAAEAPLYDHARLRRTVGAIARAHAGPFRADLVADPDRLCAIAVAELADFDLVRRVGDGVVLSAAAARYRPRLDVEPATRAAVQRTIEESLS